MTVSTSTRKPKTREEYRAEQRQRVPINDPLTGYDADLSMRVTRGGILREWPPCTCGADHCPDKGAA
ncbi:hypothetical protein ABT093_01325 [Kitasatospora sp. NPDC002551]|uniref:hypothetical protein n=1 Tax=Kitasatospora sp. NPDC002551 TaxID=3154539 RepID=UPI00332F60D1